MDTGFMGRHTTDMHLPCRDRDGVCGTALAQGQYESNAQKAWAERPPGQSEMKKGIVTLMLAAAAAFAAGTTQSFTGVITDSMCGKSHKAIGVTPDGKCVRDCVHADPSRYKCALYDGRSVYILSDQQTPERFASQKVIVTGVLDQKTNTIHVGTIAAAK
jgi:hypothetical protein